MSPRSSRSHMGLGLQFSLQRQRLRRASRARPRQRLRPTLADHVADKPGAAFEYEPWDGAFAAHASNAITHVVAIEPAWSRGRFSTARLFVQLRAILMSSASPTNSMNVLVRAGMSSRRVVPTERYAASVASNPLGLSRPAGKKLETCRASDLELPSDQHGSCRGAAKATMFRATGD